MKKLACTFVVLGGCAASGGEHLALRAAVDRAEVSLAETVVLGETSLERGTGIDARIVPRADQFAVSAVASAVRHELRLDLRGAVVSTLAAGAAETGCQTQITLAQALAIAEGAAGGNAVAVVPDDDDPCMREVQVLVGTELWEVKVGTDGTVIEQEPSDEEI